MIKKICILLTAILLLGVLAPVHPLLAADKITVIESSAEAEFPDKLIFTLSAEGNVDITDVRLFYYVDRLSYAHVTSEVLIDIIPDRRITAEWAWDMRKTGGMPPGTNIQYWWSIRDGHGNTLETLPVTLSYDDARFEWERIRHSGITLYWHTGDMDFGEELMSAAIEGLDRLYQSTGADITDPIEIYIYANSNDLRSAMIFPQTWTGGVAYPLYNCIAIGIESSNIEWGLRTIVHELTHLVIHRMTYNPYLDLPVWLDEGLAMYMEGPLTEVFTYYLGNAVENDTLISVRSLASPFSAYADQSYLSYAQSHSLVSMLIDVYGREKMLELLTVMTGGIDYDEALEKVYGFNMDGLDEIWRDYIIKKYLEKNNPSILAKTGRPLPALTLFPASGRV
ncbi:MAG: peptidase MA domain-containing protein [Dehalococcoidales bacterium]|nr:MAG: peptidase MA domain-containing protein [Dehalococcoidales bacterium]